MLPSETIILNIGRFYESGERAGIRTLDLLIKSQLLYRLSYALPYGTNRPRKCAEHTGGFRIGQHHKIKFLQHNFKKLASIERNLALNQCEDKTMTIIRVLLPSFCSPKPFRNRDSQSAVQNFRKSELEEIDSCC